MCVPRFSVWVACQKAWCVRVPAPLEAATIRAAAEHRGEIAVGAEVDDVGLAHVEVGAGGQGDRDALARHGCGSFKILPKVEREGGKTI